MIGSLMNVEQLMELELAVETYVVAENLHKWHFTDHKSPMI
jgi:hypothetical protein